MPRGSMWNDGVYRTDDLDDAARRVSRNTALARSIDLALAADDLLDDLALADDDAAGTDTWRTLVHTRQQGVLWAAIAAAMPEPKQ